VIEQSQERSGLVGLDLLVSFGLTHCQGSSLVEQPRKHSGLVSYRKLASFAHEIYARVAQW
jgi:hypothetical protein